MQNNLLSAKNIATLKRATNLSGARVILHVTNDGFFLEVDTDNSGIRFELDTVPNNVPDGMFEVSNIPLFKRFLTAKNPISIVYDDGENDYKIKVGNYRLDAIRPKQEDVLLTFDKVSFTHNTTDISAVIEGINVVSPSILGRKVPDARDFLRCATIPKQTGKVISSDGASIASYDVDINLDFDLHINLDVVEIASTLNHESGTSALLLSENRLFTLFKDYKNRYEIVSKTLDRGVPLSAMDLIIGNEGDKIGLLHGAEFYQHIKAAEKIADSAMFAKRNGIGATYLMTAPGSVDYEAVVMHDTNPHNPILMNLVSLTPIFTYAKTQKLDISFIKSTTGMLVFKSDGYKLIFAAGARSVVENEALLGKAGIYLTD